MDDTQVADILEHITDVIYIVDGYARITYVNRTIEEIWGRSRDDLLGKNLWEEFPQVVGNAAYYAYLKVLRARRPFTFEYLSPHNNRWYDVRANPSGAGLVVYFHDITDRKRVQVSLHKAQLRTESILSSVADSHILHDRQWRYLYVNAAAIRAIGRPSEQILGRTLWDIYPDIIDTELGLAYRRAMDERIAISLDYHYVPLDRWWANRFYPVPEGLAVFATEITERKQAEIERERLFEQLQQLSHQLLQAQEAERRAIARELHDEFGQQLTAVGILLSMMEPLRLPRLAREPLENAQTLVIDLIGALRSLALNLRPAVLDDFGLVPALAELFRQTTTNLGVAVRFEHEELGGQRFGSEVEITAYRIVQEALTNIARYAGVMHATVRLQLERDTLSILIKDQGNGFDTQTVSEHISAGLIGMAERAALVGGILTIETAIGVGTQVTAVLPLPPPVVLSA